MVDEQISPLVSVIIPCYNAERWVAEAIQSCLDQTYRPIEIIVIDDGSTDGSLEVIKNFGDAVKWETGPNRGGNAARNRGFALSQGEYIQFLDADDYILPEKFERQVQFLQETGADGVYGDYRWFFYCPDGKNFYRSRDYITGEQDDMLESWLRPWTIHPHVFLYCRDIVVHSGGWDEQRRAGQDRAFLFSILFKDAVIRYQPGFVAVYRRYGNYTVSTIKTLSRLEEQYSAYEEAEKILSESGKLTIAYRRALAETAFLFARKSYQDFRDWNRSRWFLEKTMSLYPDYKPKSRAYSFFRAIFGFRITELISIYKRRLMEHLFCRRKKRREF